MEVEPTLEVHTSNSGEIEMATSPQPLPVDGVTDEQMMDDAQPVDVIDDGDYAVEDELYLDESEVAMADQPAQQEQDHIIDDELGYSEPAQFGSPPAGLVNPDGTQTSALGNSAADAQLDPVASLHLRPFELDEAKIEADLPDSVITAQNQLNPSATPYIPEPTPSASIEPSSQPAPPAPQPEHAQSQSRSLSPSRALAAQHQHSSDETKHQDQSIRHQNSHHMTLNQSQDMSPGADEDPAKQKNQVDIEHKEGAAGEKDEVEVTTKQENEGGQGGKGGAPVQNNEVNVFEDGAKGSRPAGCTCGEGGKADRPELRKDLLEGVEFEVEEDDEIPEEGSVKVPLGPVVLLVHQNTTFSLFRPTTDPTQNQPLETLFPAAPVPEDSPSQSPSPELYYAPLAALFAALRLSFPAVPRSEELVMSFEAIGISLAEDNVHAGQVSLFDFDRIQVGCGLPGRLQVTLESQPRFSTGFNALAEHIARSREGGEDAVGEAQGGEEALVGGDDGDYVDGEYAGEGVTSATDDETHAGEEGDESEYYEPEVGEEYNLEEALAEMDSDDLEAVIEGVEEDYIHSEEAVYEAHDGDSHDEHTEGDDAEPDVLLPEEEADEFEEGEAEAVDASAEAEAEGVKPDLDGGLDDGSAGVAELAVGGEGEAGDEVVVAVPIDELEALDEAAELYEAAAQDVEGATGQLNEVAELDESVEPQVEVEEASARSLTDTLEDELADPVEAESALYDDPTAAVAAPAAEQAHAVATELLDEALLSPKRAREAELVLEGGEADDQAASKRAKHEDEADLIG